MGPRERLAGVAITCTLMGGLVGTTGGLALQPLTVLATPCNVSASGEPGSPGGLPACPTGPSVPLLAAEFAFLGLLMSAVGLMIMPGMRADFAEAQALAAVAARQRAAEARSRPRPAAATYPLSLTVR